MCATGLIGVMALISLLGPSETAKKTVRAKRNAAAAGAAAPVVPATIGQLQEQGQ